MTPFFFGEPSRRLFGAYHPAATSRGRQRAAVLCYPWGPEYVEAHRTLRQLAETLAGAGIHALRFDYFGTGDSGGTLAEGGVPGWRSDILTAAEELCDISGAERVSLVGLRLGALLAMAAAVEAPSRLDRLVLLDPVVDGAVYLDELAALARIEGNLSMEPVPRPPERGGGVELFGMPVTGQQAAEFEGLAVAPLAARLRTQAKLVVSGEYEALATARAAVGPALSGDARHVPATPYWVDHRLLAPGPIPVAVLRAVAELLE